MLIREIKKNRPTGKKNCKMTCGFRKSIRIRSIPAIRANLVVLADDVVLAIVGVPTKLLKMKRMAPAIQKSLDNLDFAIPSLIGATVLR